MQKNALPQVPDYLKSYLAPQFYENYSAREHSTWRYILRQSRQFFKENAHAIYLDGLARTGISLTKIPRVSDIDKLLSQYGWRAVPVRGFVPPKIFLDLQSRKILPIAVDIRTLENITYTPSPDIVHEAAGHAPILADKDYRDYICKYALIAKKAITSHDDQNLYLAIRRLSDMKENPKYSSQQVAQAEMELDAILEEDTWVSEANQISRMYWWTAEYGLVGDITKPKIYGAGLLSSLYESRLCIEDPKVKKIPLSLDCIKQKFDITKPQPQLFVARDFMQLSQLLSEFEQTMAFRQGGVKSLSKAKLAKSCTTTAFSTGLEVSGLVSDFSCGDYGLEYIWWRSKVSLGYEGSNLPGHGHQRHPEGLSTPVGLWQGVPKTPSKLSDLDLEKLKIVRGKTCKVTFVSGVCVSGTVLNIKRSAANKLLLITWGDCSVYDNKRSYFSPEWGEFDMPVVCEVASVCGGANYLEEDLSESINTTPKKPEGHDDNELSSYYVRLAALREEAQVKELEEELENMCKDQAYKKEWLLGLEILELAEQKLSVSSREWYKNLRLYLTDPKNYSSTVYSCLQRGVGLVKDQD
jgi:phenylalanine-4-hydroxylase